MTNPQEWAGQEWTEGKITEPSPEIRGYTGRVTYAYYWPEQHDYVAQNVYDRIVPLHEELLDQGLLYFFMLLSRQRGQGAGIALWESDELARLAESNTDYRPRREQSIRASGSVIQATRNDYECIALVGRQGTYRQDRPSS